MIRGICKARNESHIIGHTLDVWGSLCLDGIHVLDDSSDDDTVEICREHPAVAEVISVDLFDPDRERAEWYNRQMLFNSAMRFLQEGDWLAYFDADEHLFGVDESLLSDPTVGMIFCKWYDVYITPMDVDADYTERQWVGPETRHIPFFYRVNKALRGFGQPDQRIMFHDPTGQVESGLIRHYGKGFSVEIWDRKVEYYGNVFGPKYADKWRARAGGAVHHDYRSDEGRPLINWADVVAA